MSAPPQTRLARTWPVAAPVLAVLVLAATWGRHPGPVVVVLVALVLV
jgi:Ca2+:H+ antiporter